MLTQREAAEIVKRSYENADFTEMYPLMAQDYEHLSFWVIEVLRGKERAMHYYDGKGEAIRKSPAAEHITGTLVRITDAPDKVRPRGLFRGDVRMLEDPSFLHRRDNGKFAVLMKQYSTHEKEVSYTLAVPTVNENGLLQQVLIANPSFYTWEEL